MNKNKKAGLIALGLVAAAAWFKMTPEQKANVKGKVSDAGKKLKENLPQDLKNIWTKNTSSVGGQVVNN